jgi:hypothetical protein
MPKNGARGQLETPRQSPDVALRVERNMHQAQLVEILLQRPGERADDVEAPVLAQLHVDDADLQHMSGFRTPDGDRTGQDMRSAREAFGAGVHICKLGRNKKAGFWNELGRAGESVYGDLVTAVDRQDRSARGFEETPVTGFGVGLEVMRFHLSLTPLSCALPKLTDCARPRPDHTGIGKSSDGRLRTQPAAAS